jgi:hypothetical protein
MKVISYVHLLHNSVYDGIYIYINIHTHTQI